MCIFYHIRFWIVLHLYYITFVLQGFRTLCAWSKYLYSCLPCLAILYKWSKYLYSCQPCLAIFYKWSKYLYSWHPCPAIPFQCRLKYSRVLGLCVCFVSHLVLNCITIHLYSQVLGLCVCFVSHLVLNCITIHLYSQVFRLFVCDRPAFHWIL